VLYSDMGRVLCSVVSDTCGWHDTITGVADASSSLKKYGPGDYQALRNDWHRNSRDNLLVELGKYELGKRDFGATVNFFSKVAPDAEGKLSWVPGHAKAGSIVELRSEMNTLVVLSNTPHPLDPNPKYTAKTVQIAVRWAEPVGAEDACKTSCPENERGFALTDAYFT
jgi:urea carboxylase-associated protein 2